MAQVLLRGNPVNTVGELPAVGAAAPDFTLVNAQLGEVKLADFAGKKFVISVFPSIDTPTCATSTRKFNQEVTKHQGINVVTVSADLPFALTRFCAAEGIENVHTLSSFRSSFGQDYGLTLAEGPLKGVLARAVLVVDESGKVVHTELVENVSDEPNYEAALKALGV